METYRDLILSIYAYRPYCGPYTKILYIYKSFCKTNLIAKKNNFIAKKNNLIAKTLYTGILKI